jgi:ATP-dependent DNA helicase PIF1
MAQRWVEGDLKKAAGKQAQKRSSGEKLTGEALRAAAAAAVEAAAARSSGVVNWPARLKPTVEFEAAARFVLSDKRSLFITGKAGTGKSTFLRALRASMGPNTVVLAPTGLAAVGVGGQTIHSFFGFPPRAVNVKDIRKSRKEKLLKNLDTVIIDEISMVRADLMDGVDKALRINRGRPNEPFGGVQVVTIGDLHQLPPVVREGEERQFLDETYGGSYFFHAPVFGETGFSYLELSQIFRQDEEEFVNALNGIREGRADPAHLGPFNARVMPFAELPKQSGHVILTPINSRALDINTNFLKSLQGDEHLFQATLKGEFEQSAYPTNEALVLKQGAKVILLRNDPDRRWFNGSIAKIDRIDGERVWIKVDGGVHELEQATWENIRYELDAESKRLEEKVVGSFKQLPVRLAWALTIHKSQGMTLDKVFLDLGRGAFAHGQTYVALSRGRSLAGLALQRAILPRDVIFDRCALGYRTRFEALGV